MVCEGRVLSSKGSTREGVKGEWGRRGGAGRALLTFLTFALRALLTFPLRLIMPLMHAPSLPGRASGGAGARPLMPPPRRAVRPRRAARPAPAAFSSSSSPAAPRGASGMDIAGSRPTSKRAWEAIQRTLKQADVTFVSPQEVAFAVDRPGALVLDCRPPAEFAAGHIPGAVSIPLYRPITGLSPRAIARRTVFAFFGVLNGTESNPDFWPAVAAAAGRAREVIVYCNTGGCLEGSETKPSGQQSRSLSAAYEIVIAMDEEGYTTDGGTGFLGLSFGGGRRPRLAVLKGGFYEWRKGGRDVEEGA